MELTEGQLNEVIQKNKPQIERILLYVTVFLLLLFTLKGCFDTSKLEGQAIELKKNIKISEKQVEKTKKEYSALKDSISEVTKKRNDTISHLKEENKKQYVAINSLKEKNIKQKKDLEKWTNTTYVNFLKEYYKTNNVVETPKGVELQNDIPKKVVVTIFDKERFEGESLAKDTIIDNKDKQIIQEQEKTKEVSLERDKAEEVIFDQGKVIEDSNELIENSNKNIRNLKVKNTILSIGVPAAAVLGFIGGILLIN